MTRAVNFDLEGIPEIVRVRLPDPKKVFERRSARFRSLAPGHAIGDYLAALARLAKAQEAALQKVRFSLPAVTLRPAFPLRIGEWRRDESWRAALTVIMGEMEDAPLPDQSRAAMARLSGSSAEDLELSADALLAGDLAKVDLATSPLIGAAVQVYWTALAAVIRAEGLEPSKSRCPACASPPIAGVVLGDHKLRYLACPMCATEWHLARLTCSGCESTAGLSYFKVDGDAGAVKAEVCERCRTYLKLFYLEAAPSAEPFADDVATLALDFRMSDEGYSRAAANPFLLSRPE